MHIEEKVFTKAYKVYDSRHKTLNYKILMNALPLNSIINKNNKLCPMCNNDIETMSHLFIECKKIRKRWDKINHEFSEWPLARKEDIILRHENLDASQTGVYSNVKYQIWVKRCKEAFGTLK